MIECLYTGLQVAVCSVTGDSSCSGHGSVQQTEVAESAGRWRLRLQACSHCRQRSAHSREWNCAFLITLNWRSFWERFLKQTCPAGRLISSLTQWRWWGRFNDAILKWHKWLLDRVHATPEKFQSATLFLRFGLRSTLIRHENEALLTRSSNQRNLKRLVLKMELVNIIMSFWSFFFPSFLQTQNQNNRWLFRFWISPAYCGLDAKHFMRFQGGASVRFQIPLA